MTTHHDLRHEFPEYVDLIHDLKVSDDAFRKLFDAYHDLDREVRRMEDGVEPTSDDVLEEKKKQRLRHKDKLFVLIKEAAAARAK